MWYGPAAEPARRNTPQGKETRPGGITGGGDCPGLNAVIRAVARRSLDRGHDVIGVSAGWRGLIENQLEPLGLREISGILPRGGTIIGTTRTNPYKVEGGVERVLELRRAPRRARRDRRRGHPRRRARLYAEHEFPVVGVPKTIDNDLSATDYTFGFDTAVAICTEAIDRLHTTAESHNRVMVVEVMGRHAGWIAILSGIAGGADVILIPEHPLTVEETCREIEKRHRRRQGLLDRGRQRGLRADVRLRGAARGDAGGGCRPVRPRPPSAESARRSPARSSSAPASRPG